MRTGAGSGESSLVAESFSPRIGADSVNSASVIGFLGWPLENCTRRSSRLPSVVVTVTTAERLFSRSRSSSQMGSSLIVAPYMNAERRVVGALGVIGPTRLNYARVIPVVDYTARVIGRVLDGRSER